MTLIKRTIIGLFSGLVGGAIFGAAVSVGFGVPTYFAGHSFFEKLWQLVLVAGLIGAEAGLIAGGIIGLISGRFRAPQTLRGVNRSCRDPDSGRLSCRSTCILS